MKLIIWISLIFTLSACGIDREVAPPSLPSVGSEGQLDTQFFGKGFVTRSGAAGGSGPDEILAVTKDGQGRIIAVGSSLNASGNPDLVIWRLLANGNPDSSFAGQGYFVHDNAAGGGRTDRGLAVVVGSSNEIYVAGASENLAGDLDLAVWKVLANGTLDPSFNGVGYFTHDNAAGGALNDQGHGIAIDSQGRLVVAGQSFHSGTERAAVVWRLLPDGSLDASFAGGGFSVLRGTLDVDNQIGNAILLDSSDQIFVLGQADSSLNSTEMAVWKLTATGSLDPGFATGGIFTHGDAAGGDGLDVGQCGQFDSSGRLVIGGYSRNIVGNNDLALWRLTTSGNLDGSFGDGGFTAFDLTPIYGFASNEVAESLVLDSQGRLLVIGTASEDLGVWRFSPQGELDTTYANNGLLTHDSAAGGFSVDSGKGGVLDSEGRLVIGGYSRGTSNQFEATFWRLR